MQNMPIDERTLLRRIDALEKRIASLETSPRAGNTSISGGKLTVGAPGAANRIEVSATDSRIRFNSAQGPTDLNAFGGAGAALVANSTVATIPTRAVIWNTGDTGTLQVSRVNSDGSTSRASEVYASLNDMGGGLHAGQVQITATGTDHDNSAVNISADGGAVLYTNGRTTDPPVPPLDCVTLYVKANRLYYRDGNGTVRGPL